MYLRNHVVPHVDVSVPAFEASLRESMSTVRPTAATLSI
jgi:hypothetical protein